MRPRKRVRVVAESDSLLQQHTMLLNIWGYALVTDPDELTGVDCVLAIYPSSTRVRELSSLYPGKPLLCRVYRPDAASVALAAGATVCVASAAEVRERLQILTSLKRGPKQKETEGGVHVNTRDCTPMLPGTAEALDKMFHAAHKHLSGKAAA